MSCHNPIAVFLLPASGEALSRPTQLTVGARSQPETLGSSYSQTLAATGGAPPYVWTVSGVALRGGLTLTGKEISGTADTPNATRTFSFTAEVTDSAGATAAQVAETRRWSILQ